MVSFILRQVIELLLIVRMKASSKFTFHAFHLVTEVALVGLTVYPSCLSPAHDSFVFGGIRSLDPDRPTMYLE